MNWIVKIIIDKEYPIIFNYKILKIWATIFNIIIGIIRFFDFVLFLLSHIASPEKLRKSKRNEIWDKSSEIVNDETRK